MNSNLMLSGWGRKLGKSFMRGNKKFKPQVETHKWKIVRGDNVVSIWRADGEKQTTLLKDVS